MISAISAGAAVNVAALSGSGSGAPVAKPAAALQDTVHISKQALAAAGGDADHDGDSH